MGLKGSDITIAKNDGIVAWATIVSLAESPKRAGVLYAGTDDGQLQVTRDGGKTWTNVTAKLPDVPKGVLRVRGRAVALRRRHGLRHHRRPSLRTTTRPTSTSASDFGQTWQSLRTATSKAKSVKTITEDQKNPDVLYLGTETGLFVSIDRGEELDARRRRTCRRCASTRSPSIRATTRWCWRRTAARSGSSITSSRSRSTRRRRHATDAKLFTPPPYAMFRRPARDRNYEFWGDQVFYGENPPAAAVISWFEQEAGGDVKLRITDAAGTRGPRDSGSVLAKSTEAGIQTRRAGICACSRRRAAAGRRPWRGGRARGEAAAAAQGTTAEDRTRRRPWRQAAERRRRRQTESRSAPAAAAAAGSAAAASAAAAATRPARSSSAAPTRWRWSSTARPSTPSRCASPTIPRSCSPSRAQAHVRHGDGDARRCRSARHRRGGRASLADAADQRSSATDRRRHATTCRPT